jgi:hypothetical protein
VHIPHHWDGTGTSSKKGVVELTEGVIFMQLDGNSLWKKNRTCNNCRKKGHFARECRNNNKNVDQVHTHVDGKRTLTKEKTSLRKIDQ